MTYGKCQVVTKITLFFPFKNICIASHRRLKLKKKKKKKRNSKFPIMDMFSFHKVKNDTSKENAHGPHDCAAA